MAKWTYAFLLLPALASASIINSNAVDPSLFTVSTFASGLSFPTDIMVNGDGSALVSTSPNYGYSPAQLMYLNPNGTVVSSVFSPTYQGLNLNGMLTGSAQMGSDLAVGTFGIGYAKNTINILQPGVTPDAAMTAIASLRMTYPNYNWEHPTVGMAARPTPGVAGSYDLIVNVGSEYDYQATPPTDTVSLTGSGFASTPSANLQGDSLYMIRVNTDGAQPTVTAIQQVATGIRNVYGMAFNAAGDLYFTDNAIDVLPSGSTQPTAPDGEPPQADELNMIAASQLGVGAPVDFGFPNCYIQYAYGGVPGVPVGTGCVQPILAFQPITDINGVQHELEGPTDLAFAPANFPAPYNNGIFVGFSGGESPNDEAGLAFYSFATNSYLDFIQAGTPGITDVLGVTSSASALYISDFGTGKVYEIQGPSTPEPGTGVTAGLAILAAICRIRKKSKAT